MRHPRNMLRRTLCLALVASSAWICERPSAGSALPHGASQEVDVKSIEEARSHQVPFTLVDDHILIPVTVNGRLKLDMILDTGLGSPGAILLDSATGEDLGLKYLTVADLGGGGDRAAPTMAGIAAGATLSVAGVDFTGQQLMVIQGDLFENLRAEGIIGATLFEHIVQIDYERSVLSLHKELPGDPSQYGQAFGLSYSHGIPVMEASIAIEEREAVAVRLLVDTGVNDPLLVFPFSEDRLKPPGRVVQGVEGILSEGMSGKILGTTGRIRALALGSFVFRDVVASFPERESWGPAMLLGQNGMLGNEVLQRFHVVFDYGGNRLYLKPNGRPEEPWEYNMAGLIMRAESDGYKVIDLIRESPAREQGIRSGDFIVAIDGRPIGEYPGPEIGRIFRRDGSVVRVTVKRGEERFERSLVLRRLI